ncbi:sigma-70 family RNA polymerase sigma factor [Clostridiales Family XIII bacterium ASD5510]|uniref:Sigma-70 family RNA polymerase sigma factor n=1 Tax=Hominibacterium faecale TaxID=2839743 RepID=A0A9J6QZ84_9FIRM|nr:sigma-70 family RNA polymerase sigma factor [Hominibacterium faecale]MCU7380838.1 sigma-70 family RNA polymerase sigma factor [Hominibacterium faecale]
MTKNRLKKLRSLIKEAEHLEEQIRDLPFRTGPYVADSAKDYRTGFPRTILIRGYSTEQYDRLKRRLGEKLCSIQSEIAELEAWLDGVEDPQTRDILRLQYGNGLTQEEIAEELGINERTVRRKIKKVFSQCP